MLKTRILILALFVTASTSAAQTVYQVPANSKGNSITLTVANESPATVATNVNVTVARKPAGVTFEQDRRVIKMLPAGKETDVAFTFDVGRDVKISAKDTVEFAITDKLGSTWKKSLVLAYSGPAEYKIEQNFPNPFNPSTAIEYMLPVSGHVTLKVYDILGRVVQTLVDAKQYAGNYSVTFNADRLSTGVYFYELKTDQNRSIKKMLLLK